MSTLNRNMLRISLKVKRLSSLNLKFKSHDCASWRWNKNTSTSDKSSIDSTFNTNAIWSKRVNLLLTFFFKFSKANDNKLYQSFHLNHRQHVAKLMSQKPDVLFEIKATVPAHYLEPRHCFLDVILNKLLILLRRQKKTSIFSATRKISRSAKLAKTSGDSDILWSGFEKKEVNNFVVRTWGYTVPVP